MSKPYTAREYHCGIQTQAIWPIFSTFICWALLSSAVLALESQQETRQTVPDVMELSFWWIRVRAKLNIKFYERTTKPINVHD